ncbi:tRNA-(ms[2]io[6]A)-hydroxylase [Legionella waltersii]|uniref:tRNA--hydroxylase n=1 Tax=Legionella waltersii TaxID=66969 RepID=A0A0W1A194_9GAMM|nr:tRNA-(ms[2]io[6]A)-hydroxylase [Legionella waltersii]KTD75046.1 TRNA--hydroxylase [Legionella waltersii]SNV05388.1 tRNA-(ms(2)io(6)a)-hydrolase(tRNA hydroxylase) [Legionella waltersii]
MLKRIDDDLQILIDFLQVSTPESWLDNVPNNLSPLLLDHAHCERKAAGTAISLISKYPEKQELVALMSPLAREELLHFEKVLDIMKARKIPYGPIQPSEYASTLHKQVTNKDGIERLCDQLIVGAIIEARSCERFNAVIPYLGDPDLSRFYRSLVKSESRHFKDYLQLSILYGEHLDIKKRTAEFLAIENSFILSKDCLFRFHSGIPM